MSLDTTVVKAEFTIADNENLYTTRNCWVQLERCPVTEKALRLHSAINISRLIIINAIINANSLKKPYHCKICKTIITPLYKYCTKCHMKNLKPTRDCSVKLERCDNVKMAQFTKKIKSKLNKNESYMSEKSYSCEMCNINLCGYLRKENRRFCSDCELEQATKQLRTVIKFPFYCHLCKKIFKIGIF